MFSYFFDTFELCETCIAPPPPPPAFSAVTLLRFLAGPAFTSALKLGLSSRLPNPTPSVTETAELRKPRITSALAEDSEAGCLVGVFLSLVKSIVRVLR